MAPIAGYTDSPFRRIVGEAGAGLVYTELISSDALVRRNGKTMVLLRHSPAERPLNVQLLGKDPGTLVDAAMAAIDAGADMIDLNLGCPARTVVANGAGAALLKEPGLVKEIMTEMRKAIAVPFTLKTRTGWDDSSKNILQIVETANECGIDAIAIHLRTRAQGFKKGIDMQDLVGAVRASRVPVIGNGDILTPQDAKAMMEVSGCAGVMIGRGALGAPWIFGLAGDYLQHGRSELPSLEYVRDTMLRHLGLMVEFYGEAGGVMRFRKHLVHYSRGGPVSPLSGARYSSRFRAESVMVDKYEVLVKLIGGYFDSLMESSRVQN
ncbi:MAG: tRNA dihydrouridine synthase DusB [Deltaproteobacteria bacterium]|nr:tRNA dihydrouridine synthase DusB [Deltaproteobacteria bacterium]